MINDVAKEDVGSIYPVIDEIWVNHFVCRTSYELSNRLAFVNLTMEELEVLQTVIF